MRCSHPRYLLILWHPGTAWAVALMVDQAAYGPLYLVADSWEGRLQAQSALLEDLVLYSTSLIVLCVFTFAFESQKGCLSSFQQRVAILNSLLQGSSSLPLHQLQHLYEVTIHKNSWEQAQKWPWAKIYVKVHWQRFCFMILVLKMVGPLPFYWSD